MRDTGIADRLRAAGLRVSEAPGWQQRGSSSFDPRGVMWHHTASAIGKDAPSLGICINGRPDLAGPLCHVLVSRSGICHVIAAGRANHAGAGVWPPIGGGSNSAFYGIEAENTGYGTGPRAEPWTEAQLDVIARATAALLSGNASQVPACCMHKEYAPRRKIDMHTISGDSMRARTLQPCNVPTPPAPVPPPAPGIDLAAIAAGIAAASKQIVKQGSRGDAAKWAQALLNNKLGGPDLAVDGNFGPASVAATRIFQRNVKKFFKLNNSQMKVDGIIGPATWFWLTR